MVSVPATHEQCLRCKGGKLLCGLSYCPIVVKSKALIPLRKILPKMKDSYFGPSPPGVFVGRFGYPKVRIGPMASVDTDSIHYIDEPDYWKTNMSLEDIVGFRAKLLRFIAPPIDVNSATEPSKIMEITQEQVQASSPVDLEISFNKKPRIGLSFNRFTQPMGCQVQVNSLQLASTPKIEYKTDRIVSDTDMYTNEAILRLYSASEKLGSNSRAF